jgi:hypothetical protein
MSFPPPPPPPPPPFSAAWYGFEPCCGGNILYFRFDGTTNPPIEGINIYDGPAAIGYDVITDSYVPLSNQCYRIFRGNAVDPMSPINGGNYNNLQVVPTDFGSNYTWDSTTNYETPCGDEEITCPECQPITYDLWPCDNTLVPVTTDTDLSAYLNEFALIEVSADEGFNCYYVTISTDSTNVITVVVDGDVPCTCDCTCYEIIGSAKLRYVDCDGNAQSTIVTGYWKECSQVYPITSPAPGPNLIITNNGNCVDGSCPSLCYRLRDCDEVQGDIFSTAQSLGPYAILGQVVQIQGYDNCWQISSRLADCDCAINVVVLQAYDTCQECNPAPNYLLTNCDDQTTIIYTSTDLSEYVNQVVELNPDCPGCWIVSEINGPIPSDVPISVSVAFDDCEACKTTYYVLSDCAEIEANIITSTDLSDYVNQIIVLEWCPTTCWSVAVSETSTDAGVLGNILGDFNDCTACLRSFPCVCSRIKNHDIVTLDYKYLDCDGAVQTITLAPGERSERMCIAHWYSSYSTDYVEYFGDCIDRVECPPQIYPKRKITPGYKTPICSTEKYEKITCKSAEILYKQVLTLRYGISNCCPDEDNKWLVKKELIDLQALKDPDYTCDVTSCGCNDSPCSCNHSSCGCGQTSCGCNTNLRACNSQ